MSDRMSIVFENVSKKVKHEHRKNGAFVVICQGDYSTVLRTTSLRRHADGTEGGGTLLRPLRPGGTASHAAAPCPEPFAA